MEDMASALGSLLNNPQTMQQIMNLANQLGLGGDGAAPAADAQPPAAPPPAQPAQPQAQPIPPLQNLFTPPPAQPAAPNAAANLLGSLDVNTIAKVSQILQGLNTRDSNVELLLALKPHFGEKRQKKVDDAIRIMQLVKMLPLLKETGIFGNLFGGDDG
ncbi:hypothetical protein [Harryflintia acetispora]|uniref:Uncharacterized protein n=1 Tax=Harryflintia acetispora TaxID=1849041 RepID=A0A9X8Y7Y3_9FIRM|nr:hypothetical protein [Harryflintia acetispora]TCL43023.1 hypothetical protein EDD78_107125 [Harryflintia acetispora]